jgi:hypothetical protein
MDFYICLLDNLSSYWKVKVYTVNKPPRARARRGSVETASRLASVGPGKLL